MNSAKKVIKNNGLQNEGTYGKQSRSISKNVVLIVLGVLLIAVLCGGVAWINLRPRVILTVEGESSGGDTTINKVYYAEAMYDIYQAELMPTYYSYYGMTFDWDDTNDDGDTYATYYKKSIMKTIKQREILYMCALADDISLTDDEKEEVDDDVESFRENLTDNQKKIKGLDVDTLTKVLTKEKLGDKYKDTVIDTLDIDDDALKETVDKDSYRQYTLQYYMFSKTETDDDGNTVDKSAKDLKKGKKAMEELRTKALKADDFTSDVITDEDSDGVDDDNDAISYATEDLIETDEDFMTAKARKQIKKMKNDEISDVMETDDGYYVIKMVDNNDSEAYDAQCESVISQEEETQFESMYKTTIKAGYIATAQSFWKGRVTIGYLTYDEDSDE